MVSVDVREVIVAGWLDSGVAGNCVRNSVVSEVLPHPLNLYVRRSLDGYPMPENSTPNPNLNKPALPNTTEKTEGR